MKKFLEYLILIVLLFVIIHYIPILIHNIWIAGLVGGVLIFIVTYIRKSIKNIIKEKRANHNL